jgi:arginyl-tRNA synthetase
MIEINTLKKQIQNELISAVKNFIKNNPDLDLNNLKIKLEYSRNEKFGDYSTAFLLENKEVFGDPEKASIEFMNSFDKTIFETISFTKPGFINFRVKNSVLIQLLKQILKGDVFVQTENKEKIIFEYVSANPTGPLNIVSARAAATGDSICNLLDTLGHEVHREFYVNDYGNQVSMLGVSVLTRIRELYFKEEFKVQEDEDTTELNELLEKNILPKDAYRGEYIISIAESIYQKNSEFIKENIVSKNYTILIEKLSEWAVDYNLTEQKKDLESFGTKFHNFYSEKSLHDSNLVLKALEKIEKDISVFDGKKVFLSTRYGDDKDRVVVREDGRPTYLLADIAYHKTKLDRGFTKILNIWGPDHHGYIARLKGAILSLGASEDTFKVLIAQQVNLLSKGEKQKMGKRIGKFKTMNDLTEYLGVHAKDVGRYFFIMRALESPLDFDLDLAKEESDKNPVFYIQYAHARICSIFREVSIQLNNDSIDNVELNEERRNLLFYICRFPEEVYDSAKNLEPHRLANFLQNLSKVFTKFYSAKENRIKDCDETTKSALGLLSEACRICISSGLKLLGIEAPQKMGKD